MSVTTTTSARERSLAATANRWVYWLCHHWLLVVSLMLGL